MTLAERIKDKRWQIGKARAAMLSRIDGGTHIPKAIPQTEAAGMIGIALSTLRNAEQGARPSPETLALIEQFLKD